MNTNLARLRWSHDPGHVTFSLEDASRSPVPVSEWGRLTIDTERGRGSVGHLLGLVEDDQATVEDSSRVHVTHDEVAALEPIELERLGLPPASPHRLELKGSGLLTSSSFRFCHRLIGPNGRPSLGTKRTGALLRAGNATYTLLDPLYSLIEGIEAFNQTPPGDQDGRFLIWADLKKLLPDDAVVDDHLRTMNIVRADAISLDYTPDEQIHPVLLAKKIQSDVEPDFDPGVESLTPEAQQSFAQRFERAPTARARYALEGGWYVVLGDSVREALKVVKDFQGRSVAEKRALLANPMGILKEHLGDSVTEEQIENVFEDTPEFVSARVQRLGAWSPKLCAYKIPSTQNWLPPEETVLGIPLQGKLIEVPIKAIPALMDEVHGALDEGKTEIVYEGQSVPISEETMEQLQRLAGTPRPMEDDKFQREATESANQRAELVPQIIDNLESLGFEAPPRQTRGQAGGLPAVLRSEPYFHQRQGLEWLQEHWVNGSRGALLADDMGLGKTLQTLAFVAWVQEQMEVGATQRKPFLIVAPTGLLRNWEDEAKNHLVEPGLGELVKAYGGNLKELLGLSHREQMRRLRESDWVMTTYETLRDRINAFIGVKWGIIAYDEAQKIKTPTARMTEMAKSLEADFILALTGTPVENSLSDLWSIVDMTNPGLFGSLQDFRTTYETPSQTDPQAAAPISDKIMKESKPAVMLRRLKEDHLPGLPEKTQSILKEPMSAEQAAAYSEVVAAATAGAGEKGSMMKALQDLRRISVLGQALGAEGLTDTGIEASARLRAMVKVLDELKETGEKALIFVEYLDLQEVMIPYLQRRYGLSHPPLRISGSVSGTRRKSRVDEFQAGSPDEFDVMLLSPKAGGVGLTLTAANHVIHLTRWWNPAVEDQCTDRVYRIGQKKPVHVHLPMAIHPTYGDHSFDKNLHALLESKRKLSRSVLAPSTLNDSDVADLFENSVGAKIGAR